MEIIDFATLLPIIGAITVLTNIIVQALKQVTKDKLPSNLVALAVAMVLTLGAGAAYAQIKGIAITWYLVVAAVVVGFMVAYAAMFGYDKLMQTIKELHHE